MRKRIIGKRKSAWLVVLCLAMLLGTVCTACGEDEGAAGITSYSEAKNGVAVVECTLESMTIDKVYEGGHGSGFFVGTPGEDPQYLITNHHVVERYLQCEKGEPVNMVDSDTGETVDIGKAYIHVYFDQDDCVEAYVVDSDETADVAVLKLDKPTDKREPLRVVSPTSDIAGSTAYALGYPGISDNWRVDSTTRWGLDDATITSGAVSRLLTGSGTGVRYLQIDVTINGGNSGGPLVDESGAVLGINTQSVKDLESDASANYAVNIDEAITLLDLHDIPYATKAEASSGTSGATIGLIVGIAAGAVVVVVIIVLLLVNSKKKKKAAANGNADTSAGASQEPAAPISPTGPAVPPQPAPAPGPAASPQKSAEDSGYRLQGVSGALEGRRFMIRKDSPLTLGRDSKSCNVSFPENTAGVSGKHCQVWYDDGRVYLKDLGSSHGTFIAPGRKLSASQPVEIKPGESFYLGSENETLVLAQKGGN